MKRMIIAIAAGLVAATAFTAPEARAGGFGIHLSPVFIPTPRFHGNGYARRNWRHRYEDRYERRERRMRAERLYEQKRRRAAIARERAAEAKRRAASAAAAEHAAEQKRIAAAEAAAALAAASPPPLPARKVVTAAISPVPTEALLTRQETRPRPNREGAVASSNDTDGQSVVIEPVQPEASSEPAALGCKMFLPGAGLTVSVPCEN
ncbi:MAG: hypothetical protein RLZ98_67 [Pseudomonadota bacterium]|jgi:hypothetical protein